MREPTAPSSILLLIAIAACGEPGGEAPGERFRMEEITIRSIETDIFETSCAISDSCHRGPAPTSQLSLDPPAYARLVGQPAAGLPSVMLVVPGDSAASFLYQKLSEDSPPRGVRMPPGQPLSSGHIERVRAWIEAGATDD